MVFACLAATPVSAAVAPADTESDEPAPAQPAADRGAKGYRDLLTDDEDGKLDVSELIYSRALLSFLPVPILVTEPAVGYGGGMGAIFFHQPPDISSGQLVPPSVSVAAALATSDGSWAGGAGHFHSWRSDTWQAMGFAGRAKLDLSSAGASFDLPSDREVGYTLDSTILFLEASRRVVGKWRVGMRWIYLDSDVTIARHDAEDAAALAGESALGGLTLVLRYDSRDSLITPRRGQRFDLRPAWFDGAFGSDHDFLRLDTDYTGYWQHGAWVFGARVDADWVEKDAPFYAKPYVALRGVPAMERLGEEVLTAEAEVGRDFGPRWTLVGFAGAGAAWNELPVRGRVGREVVAGGVGFRYLLARVLGMRAGLDFATTSDGDHAVYVVMGSPWR